jgi:hypothetical protein
LIACLLPLPSQEQAQAPAGFAAILQRLMAGAYSSPAQVYAGGQTGSGPGAGGRDFRLRGGGGRCSAVRCDAAHSLLPRSHTCCCFWGNSH